MKAKDFALIGSAVFLAVVISIIVSKLVFSKTTSGQQVEVVPSLAANWPQPDNRYFNPGAIDPTQFISIGNSSNTSPFNSTSSQ